MADQADERLRALNASLKEALGKLTGSDELEAQGVRERPGGGAARKAKASREPPAEPAVRATAKARTAPAAKGAAVSRAAKDRSSRRKV